MGRTRFSLVIVGIVVLGVGVAYLHLFFTARYYAAAIRAQHVDLGVAIGGTPYAVRDGVVYKDNEPVSMPKSVRPLEIAYALLAAQRSPLYAIPGTDPDKLELQIDQLVRVQHEQADSLRIPSNQEYVRTALYPIDFLRALVAAERARLTFIDSGADSDLDRYLDTVDAVASAQKADAQQFKEAYQSLDMDSARFPGFGGVLTARSVVSSLDSALDAARSNAGVAAARRRCFNGWIFACASDSIALPIPPALTGAHDSAREQFAGNVGQLMDAAHATTRSSFTVALASSTCLSAVSDSPAIFRTADPRVTTTYPNPSITYAGDIFFSTSSLAHVSNGRVSAPISVDNPTMFYRCPDKGSDLSRARTVVSIYLFAQKYAAGTKTNGTRNALIKSPVIYESDAVAFLRDALAEYQSYDTAAQRQLTDLALMYKDRSSGLDLAVNEVASINIINVQLRRLGYGFDDSLGFVLGTHSGFASLLQLYNPSVVPHPAELYDRDPSSEPDFFATLQRYSKTPQYRNAIVQYMTQFKAFEQLGHPNGF